ncbi:Zinc finger protein jing [Aphelenchoides fujianensis]|nr:Zinc finger protein jing [Aphelenchoides fujianensis]
MASVLAELRAKKHAWDGQVLQTADDRFSPSRDSLDSGFDSSFPASPDSIAALLPVDLSLDGPPVLDKCPLLMPALLEENVDDEEDDEPARKMPRLLPMDAEEDEEEEEEEEEVDVTGWSADCPTLEPSTSPRSIPEVDEQPQPETAAVPPTPEQPIGSEVAAKPVKRVRLVTPDQTNEKLDDPYASAFKPRHCCAWADCEQQFFDVNDLFDHTTAVHLEHLRPNCSKAESRPTARNGRSTEDKENEDRFQCQWRDCEMSLKRGTPDKKFDWLRSHFRARHAPKAQPIRCLMDGCPIRFQTEKALHAHLLHSHDDRRPSRKAQPTPPQTTSCFGYAPPVRSESYGKYDFMDKHTFNLITQRVEEFYARAANPPKDEPSAVCADQPPVFALPSMTEKKTVAVLRKLFPKRIKCVK